MALRVGATLTFTGYRIVDSPLGVELQFLCADPGGGEPSDYTVLITDTEWATAANPAARRTLIQNKLNRKYRATGLANTLDPLIGTTLVV